MTEWSTPEEYQKMSKEKLIELVGMYARFALILDGLWFLGVEDLQGTEKAVELDEAVWRRYGRSEGKLFKRFLSVDVVESLEELGRLLLLTPLFADQGAKAEIRDGRCYVSVTDCRPQKARLRKGLGEFPCKGVGLAYLEGVLEELNPRAGYKCVICPPDEHTEDLWCQWAVWIEDEGRPT